MNLLRALPALLSLAFAQESEEAPGPPDLDELMTQVDTDKDGKISWSEVLDIFEGPEHVEQQYMEAFAECDKDDDLLISREELPTFFDKMHSILQEEDKKMGTKPSGKEDL